MDLNNRKMKNHTPSQPYHGYTSTCTDTNTNTIATTTTTTTSFLLTSTMSTAIIGPSGRISASNQSGKFCGRQIQAS